MDYNNRGTWDWPGQNNHIDDSNSKDISKEIWNTSHVNEEDLSYMFDTATPAKACGGLGYDANGCDNIYKEPEEYRLTSSQVKRRRTLLFKHQNMGASLLFEEESSPFLKSNERGDSLDDIFQEVLSWPSDNSLFSNENLDESSEAWLAEYFNDANINANPDEMNPAEAADMSIDIKELCTIPLEDEAHAVQPFFPRTPSSNIVFKGRKSLMRSPSKLASSIAHPFAIVKPSGTQGDVTLREINHRIRTPPPSKSKQDEDFSASFPKSALTGKPVVGKTTIRTEGGKGSITITRTKG